MILMLSLCLYCTGCRVSNTKIQDTIPTKTISGKILFRDPLIEGMDKPDQGLVLLDPFTTAMTPAGIFGGNARFMGNSSKLLVNEAQGKVVLFDLETKETIQVYQADTPYISAVEISYVDERHFSVVEENKLILVNIENGEKRIIAEDIGNSIHSWSNDGTTLYYSVHSEGKNDQIVRLNVKTDQKEYLFDGFSPKVSKDGNLIAYFLDGDRTKLIVKELNGKKQWEYTAPMVNFCLSPNGEYIATVEWWRGIEFYMGCTVKIVDYKAGKTQTVVPKYAGGQCYDIDWAE